MKKKELMRYVPPVIKEKPAEDERYVLAEVWENVLAVTVYNKNNRPQYTTFCSKEEKRYVSWKFEDQKWSEAMIYNLLGIDWWRPKKYTPVNDQSCRMVADYLGGTGDLVKMVNSWQKNLRHERLREKHQRKLDMVHQVTDHLPTITPAIRRWVDNTLMADERYVYYERQKKHARGWCTHCRKWHEWTVDKKKPTTVPALDRSGRCPGCGTPITWKSLNRSARFGVPANFQILTKTPFGLMVSIWHVYRYFDRDDLHSSGVDSFSATGIQMLNPETGFEIACYEHSTRYLIGQPVHEWYEDSVTEQKDIHSVYYINQPLYPGTIRTALAGTKFANLGLETFAKTAEKVNVIQYLYHAKKLPLVESAAKVGLGNLVCELLSMYTATSYGRAFIRKDETSLRKALGVSAPDLKLLRQINADYKELEFLRECRKRGRRCDVGILKKLRQAKLTHSVRQNPLTMLEYGHPDTVLRYFLKQVGGKIGKVADKYGDWYDYLEECRKLKYDLKDKDTVFPQNLQNAHEQTAMLLSQKENAKTDKQITKRLAEIGDLYTVETENFIARPARNAFELTFEGKMLHHCVGGYADRMGLGECVIVLIRRKDAPDTPLATAEMRDDRCVQIRANRNTDPPEDVAKVWALYLKTVKKRLAEQKKKRSAEECKKKSSAA